MATSIIKYDPSIEKMFALRNFPQNSHEQLVNVINLRPPTEIYKETLMPKFNEILKDKYKYSMWKDS